MQYGGKKCMKEHPLQIKKAIRQYKEINVDGLTLYPVKVAYFDDFQMARLALEAMQQSFPVALISMPFLQAVYQMDLEAYESGQPVPGLFSSALLGLSFALRLGEGLTPEKRMKQWAVKTDKNDPKRLKSVCTFLNGEEIIEITPAKYAKLRPIIAAQNGVKQESEDANPDLVKAERDIAEMNGIKLDVNIGQMIASVCALTGATEEEVDDWAILKLQTRSESLIRAMNYIVYGIGGAFGGFGKGGNPVPHPFYARQEKFSESVLSMDSFMNGAGNRAVQQAGEQTAL